VGFCNVCVCVFVYCVLVLVICILVFTVFCIFVPCILYCFVYVYIFLLILSLLPPSDNSIAVINNNVFTPSWDPYDERNFTQLFIFICGCPSVTFHIFCTCL
jgi:hypothetical protein